ncbi:hypothetical protein GWO43_22240 [candidate division KSB1 bacterium]|nr:hypothetical protein [candidate division KSB1 bacterium]NIR72621.1 hypothetical protein [candidate division KSB1 bacterium]NIS27332.1 hypothetical protein [candidate division KSB1 bacterium]NIT73545.1 hypothetical protein [candidate division KSB1 bacterium]NIU25393.1 hypothetical protein [candidate division KSB1 bacterium]
MDNLEVDWPSSREAFFDLVNSVYRHWLTSGKTAIHMEEDLQHHIAMQQIFKKWQDVHGQRREQRLTSI